ncbi:MAG: ATP-dependent zinc metalloprotease FtsH [Pirellulales bacterium]|nr:ATP-dependent zinc metalloprotease FtsH [Pirellulales bacterium]
MNQEKSPSSDPTGKPGDRKPAPQQNSNLVWYMLGFGVLVLLLITVWGGGSEQTIKWSDLVRLIEASDPEDSKATGYIDVETGTDEQPQKIRISDLGKVVLGPTEVTAKISREIHMRLKQPSGSSSSENMKLGKKETDITLRVSRDQGEQRLSEILMENNIEFDIAASPSAWMAYLPIFVLTGLFVLLFILMIRRMGGAGSPMAFGRSRAKLFSQEDIDITFDDVAGIDEAVEELREVVEFLKTPEKFQALGGRIPRGVLLVGPPGTGKTLLARAIAGEASVPFFSLSGSDFVEMFVGVGAARVRDMFQQAESRSPCIVFIDELDALGKTRGSGQLGGHDEREQTLNALLVEMDGFATNSGVIVIGATNRPETLDPALLRPGRFDRHVLVDRPDVVGRKKILDVHMKEITVDADVDVKSLAAITSGFVGADLANMVNEAALLAAREGKKTVTMKEFNEAVERAAAGLEKKSRIIQQDEKLRVAYHESGHALVAYSLPNTDPVHKVSIIPRGLAALGYTMQRPEDDRFLITQSELESRLQVLLAGTVTEELIFDDISSGAQNDLERATEIARSMVMDYGMSRLGRVNYRESNRNPFLAPNRDLPAFQHHSEQTAREIDEEIQRIIDEALHKTRAILQQRKEALIAVSKALLEHEVIDATLLAKLIEDHSPGPMIAPGTQSNPKRPPGLSPIPKTASETPASDSAIMGGEGDGVGSIQKGDGVG